MQCLKIASKIKKGEVTLWLEFGRMPVYFKLGYLLLSRIPRGTLFSVMQHSLIFLLFLFSLPNS